MKKTACLIFLFTSTWVWAESEFNVTTSLGDDATFIDGDPIEFLVTTEQAGFLYLFLIGAEGRVNHIFPNGLDSENFLTPGYFMQVPSLTANYRFVASAPYGQEILVALLNPESVTVPQSKFATITEFQAFVKQQLPDAIQTETLYQIAQQ